MDSLEEDVDEVETSVFSAAAHQRLGPDLHPQARDRRGAARGAAAARADAALRHRRRARASTRTSAPFFRDVLDHLTRVAETVDGLDQLLSTAFDAHLAQISVQQNEDMRKISAGVGLVAVPTLIAGVYGMNFDAHARARAGSSATRSRSP